MSATKQNARHRSDWLLPITAVCVALGALTAFQVRGQQQLSASGLSVRGGLTTRAEKLANMYSIAQGQIRELQSELDDARVQLYLYEARTLSSYQLRRDMSNYKMALGLLKARGKGIHLVLDDSAVKSEGDIADNPLIVHDYDILAVVNELRAAGAEAIAVNGQRITPSSAVRCVGPSITINRVPIGSPYEVDAIGDPKVLVSALELPGGILSQLKPLKIKATVQKVDSVSLPAVAEPPKFNYAVAVTEKEGS